MPSFHYYATNARNAVDTNANTPDANATASNACKCNAVIYTHLADNNLLSQA